MRLYNFDSSPNPLKVRLVLAELGLEYENKEIVLFKREQRSEDFLKVNPLGKVPVLEDGDLNLRESNAILYYLGKEYGKGLWPNTPIEESKALQWLFFESTQMAPQFGPIWFNKFGMPKIGFKSQPIEELKDHVERSEWALGHLDKHLQKNEFMMGEKFSLVDCAIGVQIASLSETLLRNEQRWPHVWRYKNLIVQRKSWSSAKGQAIWDGE